MSTRNLLIACAAIQMPFIAISAAEEIENNSIPPSFSVGAISAISAANSRAETVLASNTLLSNHLKGEFGESITEKFYLNRNGPHSNWRSITPRFGRQGIDQLYIKYDNSGRPRGLIVGEVKYGSSQLGMTRDGRQMSDTWVTNRLKKVHQKYDSVVRSGAIAKQRKPRISPPHEIPVRLGNGKVCYFWKQRVQDTWKFDGNTLDMDDAIKALSRDSDYLNAASKGYVGYRKRLFQVKVTSSDIVIDTIELDTVGNKIGGKPAQQVKVSLSGLSGKMSRAVLKKEISKQIAKKHPYFGAQECEQFSQQIVEGKSLHNVLNTKPQSYGATIALSSAKAGVTGTVIALLLDPNSYSSDLPDLSKKAGLTFTSIAGGHMTGNLARGYMVNTPTMYKFTGRVATRAALSQSSMRSLLGGGAAGAIASAIYSYGEFAMGDTDLGEANKNFAANSIGFGAGMLAQSAIIAAPAYFGATAGTGAAISGLSGAAANSAALASLGSSVGGGMYAGSIIATGGAAIVGIVVGGGVYYTYQLYDESEEEKRVELMMNELLKPKFRDRILGISAP